LDLPNVTLHH